MKTSDSLKKRYAYKLGVNLISVPISLLIAAIVPRSLGPTNYGSFTFLTEFFYKIISFFDTGTSIGFYTKLSQRLKETGLIKFYWLFVIIVTIIIMILIPVVYILNKQRLLWPDQEMKFIWMACVFSLLTWYSQIVTKIVDAYGYTARGEIIKLTSKVLGLVILLIFFFIKILTLPSYFYYNYIYLILLMLGCYLYLKKNLVSLFPNIKLGYQKIKDYVKEFWIYSHPLILYSFIGLIVGILDIWLLQKFAGSVQQGYFGLAYKLSGVCFLFASSMTPLITREFSIAFGTNDREEMKYLFSRYIPMLYAVISFLVVFLSVNASKISKIFGGDEYLQAKSVISIMVLYPIHQSYGQLSGSLFFATGQTKIYRNIGIAFMIAGLFLVYFILAPSSMYGLQLGAKGLALKMVLVQLLAVNVQLIYNSKFLKISYLKFLSHQIYTIIAFYLLALLSLTLANMIFTESLFKFITNVFLYIVFSLLLIISFPSILSVKRQEIFEIYSKIKYLFF